MESSPNSASYQSVNIISDIPLQVNHMTYDASISVILLNCKKRVLYPYLRLISIIGWRPLFFSSVEPSLLIRLINILYPLLMIVIIVAAHIQEYVACHGDIIRGLRSPKFLHLLPSLFHISAYVMVLYHSRKPESEKLETLMERVFIQSSRNAGWLISNKKLMRKLRNYFIFCMIWVLTSLCTRLLQYYLYDPILTNAWICNYSENSMLISTRIACSTWNDLICAAIVTTYSVHCQLNISYIKNICNLLRERRIGTQEFYKRVDEGKSFIEYLNDDQSVGVSLLVLNIACRVGVSLITLMKPPDGSQLTWKGLIVLSLLVLTQICLLFLLFRQALRLTNNCLKLKGIGHEMRSLHSTISLDNEKTDLYSLMLYTSTLDMKARILQIPVKASYLCFVMISLTFSLLLLAQFNYINF